MSHHHTEANSSFTDVNKEEINRLAKEGIVTGLPGNKYGPNLLVTRGEAATMISRALELNGEKRETIFS
ncbi:S-layer homology domain-containing protein [Anaerobacillus sp. HL2]|nr:S-layer homology domain-containing protein [Anaerobacillus sp. HL2]